MSYYFNTTLSKVSFESAITSVTEALKAEGFGILTEIDMQQTLKNKLGVEMGRYQILGACNPQFAHKAVSEENKIGVFLPCSVVVRETETGEVEIAIVDPIASMQAVENPALEPIAGEVQEKLKRVIASL
ncbi:MAG: DUF302 domain-containing protein [Flavobacteriales bacterium]|nr:DUF302 domain-containing protein [Flavobacteriales bacterium]